MWEARQGNPRGFDPAFIHDEAWGVAATQDGGCLVIAGTGDEYESYSACNKHGCSDTWQAYLLKFNGSGVLDWQRTFANYDEAGIDWAGEDLALSADGKAIIAVDNGQLGFLKVSLEPSTTFMSYDPDAQRWTQASE